MVIKGDARNFDNGSYGDSCHCRGGQGFLSFVWIPFSVLFYVLNPKTLTLKSKPSNLNPKPQAQRIRGRNLETGSSVWSSSLPLASKERRKGSSSHPPVQLAITCDNVKPSTLNCNSCQFFYIT